MKRASVSSAVVAVFMLFGACAPRLDVGRLDDGGVCRGESVAICEASGIQRCVSLDSDPSHCGECGTTCDSGGCAGGECCPEGVCGQACMGSGFRREVAEGPAECLGAYLHDLDADGFDDAVFTCQIDGRLLVHWGSSAPRLTNPTSIETGRVGPQLAFGDVNEDGHEDLVLPVQGEGPPLTDRIRVVFGGPSRTFPASREIMMDGNPRALALVDLDDDGHLDLFVVRPGAEPPCVYWHQGDGSGGFDTVDPTCVQTIEPVVDDNATLAVLDDTSSGVSLLHTPGGEIYRLDVDADARLLSAHLLPMPELDFVFFVSVSDVDRDGTRDIVAVSAPTDAGNQVVMAMGSEAGFESCPYEDGFALSNARGAAFLMDGGDWNGDGLVDVAGRRVCCEQPSSLEVYLRTWLPFEDVE